MRFSFSLRPSAVADAVVRDPINVFVYECVLVVVLMIVILVAVFAALRATRQLNPATKPDATPIVLSQGDRGFFF